MPFYDSALNRMVDAEAAAATWISLHTSDGGGTGAGQHGNRAQTTWGPAGSGATGGDRTGTEVSIAVAAGTTVTHWGLWTAATGGTCEGVWPLPAPETFGNAGTMKHTPTLDLDPVNA